MNNVNNNINFTARMDISKLTLDQKRWNNIAKVFEQKTAKYPNDTFSLTNSHNFIEAYNYNKKTGDEIVADIPIDKLMEMTDNKIAAKFKKMLDIAVHRDKIYTKTNKFIENMNKTLKHTEFNKDIVWQRVVNITNDGTQALKNEDSFFKNVEIQF